MWNGLWQATLASLLTMPLAPLMGWSDEGYSPVGRGGTPNRPKFNFQPLGTPSRVDQYQAARQSPSPHRVLRSAGPTQNATIAAPTLNANRVDDSSWSVIKAEAVRPQIRLASETGNEAIVRPAVLLQPPRLPAPPARDLTTLPPPQLGAANFATINNCALVTPPSRYTANSGIPCGSTGYAVPSSYAVPPTYVAPPAEFAAPAVMPPATFAPPPTIAVVPPSNAGPIRPLISFGQQRNPVQVGQGLWGQPVAYVPGQGVRNWVRYFFP